MGSVEIVYRDVPWESSLSSCPLGLSHRTPAIPILETRPRGDLRKTLLPVAQDNPRKNRRMIEWLLGKKQHRDHHFGTYYYGQEIESSSLSEASWEVLSLLC